MIRKFPSNFETLRQISVNLIVKVVYGLKNDYFNTYIDSILKVTKEDVNKAAADNIFPENIKYVITGDKNIIRPQLKNIMFADVVEINSDGEVIEG